MTIDAARTGGSRWKRPGPGGMRVTESIFSLNRCIYNWAFTTARSLGPVCAVGKRNGEGWADQMRSPAFSPHIPLLHPLFFLADI
jgi:hypothetical protein